MGTLKILGAITALAWVGAATPGGTDTQFPFFRGNRPVEYQAYHSPTGLFSIDYPKRDWKIGASGMTVLAQFTYKNTPVTVLIEQKLLDRPWVNTDTTELTAEVMTANLKNRFPGAASFTHEIRKGSSGSIVIVEFTKPAGTGARTERGRFYFLFSGSVLYTIGCTAPSNDFHKHADVFDHMALSFKAGAPSKGSVVK